MGDTLGGLAASRAHAAGPFCPGTLARRTAVGRGGSRACQGHAEGCMRNRGESAAEAGRENLYIINGLQKTSPLKPLAPPPPRLWTDAPPTIPAQQPGGGGKRHKDGQGTTQRLEFTAGPLRRLHPQCLIPGGHLRDGASVGTAATPPTPPDRPKEARALACGQALTPQEDPALWAARPGGRTAGAFGQYGFDPVDGEHAGHLPRR